MIFLKKFTAFLLLSLFFINVILVLIAGVLRFAISQPSFYYSATDDEELSKTVEQSVIKMLEKNTSILNIPSDSIYQAIYADGFIKFSQNYLKSVINGFINNEDISCENFKSKRLENLVEEHFSDSGSVLDTQEAAQSAYLSLESDIDSTIKAIPDILLRKKDSVANIFSFIKTAGAMFLPLLAGVFLFALLYIFTNKSTDILNKSYRICATACLASVTVLAPFLIIHFYDISSRLKMSSGIFKDIITTLTQGGINAFVLPCAIASAVFFVFAVTFAVLSSYIRKPSEKIS